MIETAIANAMNDPARNLFGQHGPRHHACSGLGKVLNMPHQGGRTTSASKCSCDGTGLDRDALYQGCIGDLQRQIDRLERKSVRDAKRFNRALQELRKPRGRMSRQYWAELISWVTSDGTAIASTTTEAIIFPNVNIPENYLADGRVLRLTAYGRYSTTGSPTLQFALRWNGVAGTVLAQSGLIVTGASLSAAQWKVELVLQVRANGATGSVFVQGDVTTHEDAVVTQGTVTNYGAVNPMCSAGVATPAAVTVDLSATTPLSLTADWGTNSASNTLTGHIYLIESLN